MNAALTSRLAEELARSAQARPPGPRRRAAIAELTAQGLPVSRDENWRYANLRALERLKFEPAPARAEPADLALPVPIAAGGRYVFVDGRFAPALSAPARDGAARFSALASLPPAAARPEADARSAHRPDGRFALLNEAFASDGAALEVGAPSGTAAGDAGEPVEILFVASASAQAGASYPRVELALAAGARLTLIERHVSAGAEDSFVNSAVSVSLAHGAQLEHYRLQELGARAVLFDTLEAQLAAAATYRLTAVSCGAQAGRSTLTVRLAGERASLGMAIAALGDRAQVQDTFAQVEHLAPHARTEQSFRGIAAGRARVAFNGKIVVAKQAIGTDSQQSLRGLLAGPEAEIDVRPQLEIYTDEVRCSHGATAGKLDENMLFYLLSRGIDPDTAQRLLKWAFLGDVLATIALPGARREVERRLAGVLQDATIKELL
jgi:Fe-S cluster assembly protein SufD